MSPDLLAANSKVQGSPGQASPPPPQTQKTNVFPMVSQSFLGAPGDPLFRPQGAAAGVAVVRNHKMFVFPMILHDFFC